MKTFKQFLLEIFTLTPVTSFNPHMINVSYKPRNINAATFELSKHNVNYSEGLRGLYDAIKREFYIWPAQEAIHLDIVNTYKLRFVMHLHVDVKKHDVKVEDHVYVHKMEFDFQEDIEAFFWKNIKIKWIFH